MSARFEICRVEDGYFARFVGGNNRIVWVTPGLLSRRRTAASAITAFGKGPLHRTAMPGVYVNDEWVEVRDVDLRHPDERTQP